jgi:uncharacterized membrane protein YqhA
LTRFEFQLRRVRRALPGAVPAVAVLCLALVAALAVAQVAHMHSNQDDADHCQLCIAMHTVAPVVAAAVVVVLVRLGASTPQAEPVSIARQPQIRLFIRPPPVSR